MRIIFVEYALSMVYRISMPAKKYTKELLEPIVKSSVSVMEVMRKLGLNVLAGGSHSHLTRKIKEFGIDTSHFTGMATNCGDKHRGGPAKLSATDILVAKPKGSPRTKTKFLKRALMERGREYKCYVCGIFEWLGYPIVLETEHKDGDCLNDMEENLEFICPNCHSQTNTYCGRNKQPGTMLVR